MAQIDIFTAAHCPSCPRAREVVLAFAARHPGVEVREWDLARDPGPAAGRGLFVTPAVLVNGWEILLGVPDQEQLEALAFGDPEPDRRRRVLALGLGSAAPPVLEALQAAGCDPEALDSVAEALRAVRGRRFLGGIVACAEDAHAGVDARGLRAWLEFVGRASSPWARLPLVVVTTTARCATGLRARLREWRLRNPCLVLTAAELGVGATTEQLQDHFGPACAARTG